MKKKLFVLFLTGALILKFTDVDTVLANEISLAEQAALFGDESDQSEQEIFEDTDTASEIPDGSEEETEDTEAVETPNEEGEETEIPEEIEEETEISDVPAEDETESITEGEEAEEETAEAEKDNLLVDASVSTVKGVEKIPAKYMDQLDGVNLLKITTTYEDGSEGSATLLKTEDGLGTNVAFEYEDIEEYDEEDETVLTAVRRHYVISFFSMNTDEGTKNIEVVIDAAETEEAAEETTDETEEDSDLKEVVSEQKTEASEAIKTLEYDIVFMVTPEEQIDVRNKLTFKVTENKNWKLFSIDPKSSEEYKFSMSKSENITFVIDDGETMTAYSGTDSFDIDKEKNYTVLMIYDMSSYYENN